MMSNSQTLAERLGAGPLPIADAIRIGTAIAGQLNELHQQDVAHGALTPSTIALSGSTVQFLPALDTRVTPYTAPEVLAGKAADPRSDIFAFGAIFYELLTGRQAFEGASPEELRAAIALSDPRPSGSPAVDRVVNACLAKSPEARYQRTPKLLLELRMLTAFARRGASAPAPVYVAPPPPPPAPVQLSAPVVNAQIRELEDRISNRMAEQERAIASVANVANEVLRALREQHHQAPPPPPTPVAYTPPPPPPQRTYARPYSAEPFDAHAAGGVERALDQLADRVARLDMVVGSAVERLQKLEENLDAFDTDAAALRDSVTRDIRNFERALKSQNTAIESARTAMGQTDDLVERVVEALDSLQSMFVNSEERVLAS